MTGIYLFIALLGIGYFFGRANEKQHFRELDRRERELEHILLSNRKEFAGEFSASEFVCGSVVISIDYFKRFAALFRSLIGGEIASYETLLERARREAVLRMKEQAHKAGAGYVANVKMQSSSVFANAQSGIGSLEFYAYGTALK